MLTVIYIGHCVTRRLHTRSLVSRYCMMTSSTSPCFRDRSGRASLYSSEIDAVPWMALYGSRAVEGRRRFGSFPFFFAMVEAIEPRYSHFHREWIPRCQDICKQFYSELLLWSKDSCVSQTVCGFNLLHRIMLHCSISHSGEHVPHLIGNSAIG